MSPTKFPFCQSSALVKRRFILIPDLGVCKVKKEVRLKMKTLKRVVLITI